eukprot:COSAG01_NODE_3048_length_6669_cov_138.195282_7_plen_44_part_00
MRRFESLDPGQSMVCPLTQQAASHRPAPKLLGGMVTPHPADVL